MTAVAPTSITATDFTVDKGNTITATNYVLDATGLAAGQYVHNYVTATSGNTSVATVTNSNGTFNITGVEEGTATITITAYNTDNTTTACSTTFTVTVSAPESGVSGGTVTINDYEDHNWSYYQAAANLPDGYPTDYLSSPDPRNVKITYKGGSVSGASAVAISALDGEGQNEMVYYKTMEKTVPGMTGNYPYTVISNPFSKRPATGSGNNKTYYGFAGWKVVSGGNHIAEYADNAVLPLDATIHFTNLDTNYTPNCTSAEIVFEATWTEATVQTGTSAPSFTGGTYETNFWVLTGNPGSNYNTTITVPANCTMTARYPDGTSSWDGNFTRAITAGGDNAKVEFINMASTGAVTAANYTFTMGRGIVNSNNGGQLSGCNTNANCVQTVKIESGTYASLYNFTVGLNAARNCDQLMILGCDYDRAKNDNSKLTIRGNLYVGTGIQLNRSANSLYTRTYIKSGNLGSTVSVDGNTNYTGAGGDQTYYYSVGNTHNAGRRYLCMEGGRIDDIAGGMDESNNQTVTARAFDLRVRGTAQIDGVVYGAAEYANGRGIRTMVFTGGTIKGWIAGGANGTQETNGALNGATYLYVGGKASIDSKGSTQVLNRAVGGNVFGAGCGYSASSSSGQILNYSTNVVVADDSYIERGVYGGGSYGYTTNTSNIYVLGGTVDGKNGGVNGTNYLATIDGGVYGGACQNQGGTVNLTMKGGTVNGSVYGGSNYTGTLSGTSTVILRGGKIVGSLYGGGNGKGGATNVNGAVAVKVYGGTVTDAVYGCNNVNGAPQSTVTVDIYGTDPAPSANSYALGSVFGGGNQANYNGTPVVTVHNCDNSIEYVYGGGNAAAVAATDVTIYGGNVIGNVFGGGNGTVTAANVTGNTLTKIYGGNILKVFGGSNSQGTIGGTITVNAESRTESGTNPLTGTAFEGCPMLVDELYGGGNLAPYTAPTATPNYPEVNIINGNVNYAVFGGGLGATAVVKGNPRVNVTGNVTIGCVEAGVTYGSVFGGGDAALVDGSPVVTISNGTILNSVFGGGNEADISGNTTVNMTNGTVKNRIFGGGNLGGVGTVATKTTPTDHHSHSGTCIQKPDTWTANTGKCTVNVSGGTVGDLQNMTMPDDYGYVFGASRGESVDPATNPDIDFTAYVYDTEVTISDTAFIIGGVYGGSENGHVRGNTKVFIKGGQIGCGAGETTRYSEAAFIDPTTTTVTTSNALAECPSWNYASPFATYDANNATPGGATTVSDGHTFYGNVFGGGSGYWPYKKADNSGYEWNMKAGLVEGNTYVEITGGHILTSVYGGNELTDVTGTCHVKMSGGTIGVPRTLAQIQAHPVTCYLYGAGKGDPRTYFNQKTNVGNVIVEINDSVAQPIIYGSVFGGGEDGHVLGNVYMNIWNKNGSDPIIGTWGTSYVDGNVFGAGRGFNGDALTAGVVQGNVVMYISGGQILGSIYGGGRLGSVGTFTYDGTTGLPTTCAANTGLTTVTITGGTIGINGYDNGMVNGSSRGADGRPVKDGDKYAALDRVAWVNNSVVTIGTSGQGTNFSTPLVYGFVYGGGENGHNNGNTQINVHSGTIGNTSAAATWHNGNIYGAGCGTDTYDYNNETYSNPMAGLVHGNSSISVTGGKIVHDVYGAGSMGTTEGNSTVNITGGRIENVYGGPKGNLDAKAEVANTILADVGGNTHVIIEYGSTPASDDGNTTQLITKSVFGGGEAGPVKGSVVVDMVKGRILGDVYGGGALAHTNISNVTAGYGTDSETITSTATNTTQVNLNGGVICGDAYGGGLGNATNPAYVYGNVTTTLNGTAFVLRYDSDDNSNVVPASGRVFGCNNLNGSPKGTVLVHVLKTVGVTKSGDTYTVNATKPTKGTDTYELEAFYGGGNLAGYNPWDATADGQFTSYTYTEGTVAHNATDKPLQVVIDGCAETSINYVYGGGNAAPAPSTDVVIIGAYEIGNVFGGGNAAKVIGNTNVNIGTVSTIDYVSKFKNEANSRTGLTVKGADIRGNVYGGGNQAEVTGSTDVVLRR